SSEAGSTTSHLSYVKLEFPQWQDWKRRPSEVMGDIRNTLGGIPGAEVKLSQASHGPPTGPPVNIELRGNDFRQMRLVAEDIKRKIVDIPGLINLSDDFDRSRPEIRVIIDREKTARLGLDTRTLAMAVRTAFQGRKVSEYREGKDEYDIIVRLDEEFRLGPGDLERLYLNSPSGELVPLSEMARIDTGPSYGSIKHVGLDRVITISGDASPGFSGPMLLGQVRERLTEYVLPPGMSFGFTGENRDREEAQAYLTRSFFIALFLIFLVLVTQFNSVLSPFIILSSVVLSLMGVFIGLMIHQKPFSVMMGGIGVISLAGIVVNNAIVLIDFINQLRRRGYSRREAVVMAGMVRLRPVMLTAVTTILALIPVAAGMDIDFFRFPRVVVFGGEGVPSGCPWPLRLSTGFPWLP
ncbi:MAG: efflux RND transporter permease subunit, partial [Deltaproteobacteria bacterium]|nr:efflux RND transporter permease subunit [Deltaproteobacteria bacterium]